MADARSHDPRNRRSLSQVHLLGLLDDLLAEHGQQGAAVLDIGGGTGGLAVALAAGGHTVTVVDPSPDALAALHRRAAEADLADYIRGVQGDTSDLAGLVDPASFGVVTCHRVLEYLPDPASALAELRAVLQPGGVLSVLVAQRYPATLAQAVAGDLRQALQTWRSPVLLDAARAADLLGGAGLRTVAVHGIGAIAEAVPERHVERHDQMERLLELERAVSADPGVVAAAPWAHLLAVVDA